MVCVALAVTAGVISVSMERPWSDGASVCVPGGGGRGGVPTQGPRPLGHAWTRRWRSAAALLSPGCGTLEAFVEPGVALPRGTHLASGRNVRK